MHDWNSNNKRKKCKNTHTHKLKDLKYAITKRNKKKRDTEKEKPSLHNYKEIYCLPIRVDERCNKNNKKTG